MILNRYEEALEAFQKATEIEPKNVDAWIGKGLLYTTLIDTRNSWKHKKIIKIEPEHQLCRKLSCIS